MIQHDVSEEDVLRRKQTKGIADMVYDIASSANQQLDTVSIQPISSWTSSTGTHPINADILSKRKSVAKKY